MSTTALNRVFSASRRQLTIWEGGSKRGAHKLPLRNF
eukprot:CAMPEP_0204325256 /NCGR_PEP_ID=MMETSP0469-20131031/10863_1 /ASSEMBLY_ACC=CAM_ASM_000384 /TAXON_ID=2969 /ORGANISM="Oxyrrhis marina" /LENGTH=36 /DNA_ID= /DNA_START= /DNA_END= /DNA_ORIENTATION=